MFVITVILTLFVRCKHEILTINYDNPNQKLGFVRYNREFAITVIVITEFDCRSKISCIDGPFYQCVYLIWAIHVLPLSKKLMFNTKQSKMTQKNYLATLI